jgi:DNA-directed RNA polymerase subunit H (RpoH/RPB5)
MHALQPKHIKLNQKDAEKILEKYNISKAQLPKILKDDPVLPEECAVGDIIQIERQIDDGESSVYFRVVV